MPTLTLTDRGVKAIKAPASGRATFWDVTLRGFGVRVTSNGARAYVAVYRIAGRQRWLTLGAVDKMALADARQAARLAFKSVALGADPAGDKQAAREAPTVADLSDRYLDRHADAKKKARSVAEDRRMLEKIILPALGTRKVADVTRAEVSKLHHGLRSTPYQANRVLALLSKMMNLAEKWGDRPDGSNPCRHVEKFKEAARERYLSPDELARLGEALAEAERSGTASPAAVAAIRLLTLTGCRLSEILTLRWEHVDLGAGCLRLPDSKTGAKVVHLNAPAQAVLASVAREPGSPWVIPGRIGGQHLINLEKPWRAIRARAGIEDVRLHDLRHSFASVAVAMGEGLPMIGKLLGHTQVQTTARYAHLAADPVRAATERVGNALAAMMAGTPAAEVADLDRHRRRR